MSATINATYILPFPSLFPVTSSSNLLISIKQKIFSIGNFIQKELIIFFAKSFQKKIITTKKNIHMKYIIIGGVAGGATAAARIRRNTEKAEIILFEKGEYISYANCGLPYYIGGVIEDRERLFVETPESFGKRFNIDIRTRSEVTAIDVKKKEVTVRSPKINREPLNDGLPPQRHEAERRRLLFFGVPDVQTGCADSRRLLPI